MHSCMSENLETAIRSEKTARAALNRTASESPSLAILTMMSAARVAAHAELTTVVRSYLTQDSLEMLRVGFLRSLAVARVGIVAPTRLYVSKCPTSRP
jgi:hypothetical protein